MKLLTIRRAIRFTGARNQIWRDILARFEWCSGSDCGLENQPGWMVDVIAGMLANAAMVWPERRIKWRDGIKLS